MSWRAVLVMLLGLAGAPRAEAQLLSGVAPECFDLAHAKPPDYNEQVQQDFLANYPALAATMSPLHGPIPHEPGRGAVGVDVLVVPPLSCARRFVLDYRKTEDTNKLPVAPRLRATFAFPKLGGITFYAGVGYIPPVTVAGTRTVVVSGEFGAGVHLPGVEKFTTGVRFHATMMKLIGDVATAFNLQTDPSYLDFYSASTFGLDAMAGYRLGPVVPYAAIGLTDVSTFFYVGDDGVVPSMLHPYFGPTFSAGVDVLGWDRLRVAAEFYGAPGGHSTPGNLDEKPDSVPGFGKYGHLYTGRARIALEL